MSNRTAPRRMYLVLFDGRGLRVQVMSGSRSLYAGRMTQPVTSGEFGGVRGCTLFPSLGAARRAVSDDIDARLEFDSSVRPSSLLARHAIVSVEVPRA